MAPTQDDREAIYQQGPRPLFKAEVSRQPYRRGIRYGLLLVLAAVGVWFLVSLPVVSEGANPLIPARWQGIVLGVGNLAAALLMLVGGARLTANLVLSMRRKPERVMFYDVGFIWEVRGERNKYGWNAIKAVTEDPHAWFFRGKPRLQWGAITFKMRDGATYRFTPTHGDLMTFLKRVRPYYTEALGARMGQQLRLGKSFRVHARLGVTPDGLVLDGKRQIPWEVLKVETDEKHLILNQLVDGTPQTVEKLPIKAIQNLGGFMDLVESITETFQRPNPYKK
jgi:hypothetical protein